MGKIVHIIIAGVVLINSLSSVYFKAGELSSFAIVNEYTMSLLMAFDDYYDQDFIWGNSNPQNLYDAKIYDNQYDDSSKIPAIPIPGLMLIAVNKQRPGKISSIPFSSVEYRPPPPNPPPA